MWVRDNHNNDEGIAPDSAESIHRTCKGKVRQAK